MVSVLHHHELLFFLLVLMFVYGQRVVFTVTRCFFLFFVIVFSLSGRALRCLDDLLCFHGLRVFFYIVCVLFCFMVSALYIYIYIVCVFLYYSCGVVVFFIYVVCVVFFLLGSVFFFFCICVCVCIYAVCFVSLASVLNQHSISVCCFVHTHIYIYVCVHICV